MPETEDRSSIYDINSKKSFVKKQRGGLHRRKVITAVVIALIFISIYVIPSVWDYFNPPQIAPLEVLPNTSQSL